MLKISPGPLSGTICIPPSKSHTIRAILFGCLAKGKTKIYNYLNSPDIGAMIGAMRGLGAHITYDFKTIEIKGSNGQLNACEDIIHAGNSGQVLRFAGSLSALLPTYTILTGDHSIRHNRIVSPLLSGLNQLRAFATSSRLNDKAPIIIRGPMEPGIATLNGEDSQPVSGLIMATSFLRGTTYLNIQNPGETPWIDLTLDWLKKLGGSVIHNNYTKYVIKGPLSFEGFEITIPGDFSSAAFPLIAALITKSSLTLENLDLNDVQGDKKILTILSTMGAKFDIDDQKKRIHVFPSTLKGICIDANDIIDAIPILAVAACFAEGKTEISNALIARNKESDRLFAITKELKKMGGNIQEKNDGLIIEQSCLQGAHVYSHADHRIAMSLIVAAFGARGDSVVEGTECILKSYPTFVSDFQTIKGTIA